MLNFLSCIVASFIQIICALCYVWCLFKAHKHMDNLGSIRMTQYSTFGPKDNQILAPK